MTMEASATAGWRKMAMQALIGAIVGASGMVAVTSLMERQHGLDWAPSPIILVGVCFIYVLMGLFVGFGTIAPRLFGQRMLNVADADEIVEERSNMVSSAVSCLIVGAALMLLAYAVTADAAGAAILVTPATAYGILLIVLAGFVVISLFMWRGFDELMRRLTVEVSAIMGNILMLVAVLWGGAAAAGVARGPNPLDLVSLAFGTMLLSSFVAIGRRGIMAPR